MTTLSKRPRALSSRTHEMPSALFVMLLLLLMCLPATLVAQDDEPENEWDGSFTLGWRSVDVGGREEKYRQHIDIDDGASLFGLDFLYRPKGDFADELRIDASNLGGQPFESMSFSVRKFGNYHFKLGRRESNYFYEDVILPTELSDVRLSDAGDFHHFDFRRVRDFASLNVRLNPRATLDVGFDRYSKRGESTTTLDVSRDEFEMDQPIDEKLDDFKVGFQYTWDKATLLLRETYQQYDNARSIFLPGQSPGENTTNATILDFYFLDQPTDMKSRQHLATLNLRPNDRVLVTVSGSLMDMELDTLPSERSQGISFRGDPFTTDVQGDVGLDRELELFDVDFSYLINPRVSVVAGARQQSLDQDGTVRFGSEDGSGNWEIDTTILEAGIEVAATEGVTLGFGLREENRDADWVVAEGGDQAVHAQETDHTGYYLTAGWRVNKMLRLHAEFEDSSYDDPFTLSSPTDRQRLRLQARFSQQSGFFGSGTYLAHSVENNNSQWDSDFDSLSLRAGYRRNGVEASVGYSFIDVERSVDQAINGGAWLVPIFFQSDADFVDASINWQALDGLTLGADIRFYENDGSFEREQDDFRVFADIDLTDHYLLHVGYRSVDYEEPVAGFNDYDADIAEIGFGYRFN